MGKSTVSDMFRAEGVPIFDADAEVHRLQGPGGALVNAIEAEFPGTTGPGGVDRQKLGPMVLGHPERLAKLEALIHPAVGASRKAFLDANRDQPIIIFDIPLLFEKGGEKNVDVVVVVSAPADSQRHRVLARPGMTEEKFAHILSLQTADAEKRAKADHIIDTGTTLDETRAQVRRLVGNLRERLA